MLAPSIFQHEKRVDAAISRCSPQSELPLLMIKSKMQRALAATNLRNKFPAGKTINFSDPHFYNSISFEISNLIYSREQFFMPQFYLPVSQNCSATILEICDL